MAVETRAQRWERIRAERREQIMAGAARVISRHGPDGASMALVAAECDATKVTLYAHFRSKDVLVAEVLHRWMATIKRDLGLMGGSAGDLEMLLWSIVAGVNAVTRSDAYRALSLAVQKRQGVPTAVRAEWEARFHGLRDILVRAFSSSGSPDASAHSDAFLALSEQAGPAHEAGPIVRLFLATYGPRRESAGSNYTPTRA